MPTITFKTTGITVEAKLGEWMYEVCERAGAKVPFSCKAGQCGTCATEVLEGRQNLGRQTPREIRTLQELRLNPKEYRLLCMTEVGGDVVLGKSFNPFPAPGAQPPWMK